MSSGCQTMHPMTYFLQKLSMDAILFWIMMREVRRFSEATARSAQFPLQKHSSAHGLRKCVHPRFH